MTDVYDAGWTDNAIEIYEDGVLVATVTLETGTSGVWTGKYDPEKIYTFYWVLGSYSSECSLRS